jgi:hypothetical protein
MGGASGGLGAKVGTENHLTFRQQTTSNELSITSGCTREVPLWLSARMMSLSFVELPQMKEPFNDESV